MDATGQCHASAALPPRKQMSFNVELEAGWDPELFWTSKREGEFLPRLELETRQLAGFPGDCAVP